MKIAQGIGTFGTAGYLFTYESIPAPPVLSGGKTILGTTDGNIFDSDGLEVEIPAGYDVNILYLRGIDAGGVGTETMIVGEPGSRPTVGNDSSVNHIFANINTGGIDATNFEAHYLALNNTLTGGGGSGIQFVPAVTPTNHKFSDITVQNMPFAGVFCNNNNLTKAYGKLVYQYMKMFQEDAGGEYGGEAFYVGTTGTKTALNLGIENLDIYHVWAEDWGREGLQLTDCEDIDVQQCTFYNCGNSTIAGQNRAVQIHNSQGEIKNTIFDGAQGGSLEIFAEGLTFTNCYFRWDTDTQNGLWTLANYGASARTGGNINFVNCIFDPSVAQTNETFEIHQDECDINLTNCKLGPNAHASMYEDARTDKVTFDINETGTTAYTGGVPTYAFAGEANLNEATFGELTNKTLHALGMGYRTQAIT